MTARSSRDLIVAAHQEITREWWSDHRERFDLLVSGLVLRESQGGDELAAAGRMTVLRDIPVLELEDAFHVAIATTNGLDDLLTRNCRHIANAEIAERLADTCLELGDKMPTLCTPEQLVKR